MLTGRGKIRDAYRDERVAQDYVGERFQQPLGASLHSRQVSALRHLLRLHTPSRVLEIAPGPARLTNALSDELPRRTVIVDTSVEMLSEAKRALGARASRFAFVQGDAFQLPFNAPFDFVYVFRLIRHFAPAERSRLYAEIARITTPGALLVFDAVNREVSAPVRSQAPTAEYPIYDALLRPAEIRAELTSAGFELLDLEGVQRRFPLLSHIQTYVAPRSRDLARITIDFIDRFGGGEPLEWIVTCRRR